jgi:hypothetical protein
MHTKWMSNKTTIVLALAAGFLGGIVSQRMVPAPVWAQEQASVPQEIRAHKFLLVDETGVSRGVFGFDKHQRPNIEVMDAKGQTWGFEANPPFRHGDMLPDATCQTCRSKPDK